MIVNALHALKPEAKWSVPNSGSVSDIEWITEGARPSDAEIEAKIKELQAEYEANQYQRDRASQYPSIQDVVVALAEKQEGDDTMWQEITALRQKVKSDNPKPT